MIGWISFDALSIVNARFSGESSVTSLRSRMPALAQVLRPP